MKAEAVCEDREREPDERCGDAESSPRVGALRRERHRRKNDEGDLQAVLNLKAGGVFLQDRFPKANLIGRDRDFEKLVAKWSASSRRRSSVWICPSMCEARLYQ